jgi:hypothetical protein
VVFKWKESEKSPDGDFYVRTGPGTTLLSPASAREFIKTRFPGAAYPAAAAPPS